MFFSKKQFQIVVKEYQRIQIVIEDNFEWFSIRAAILFYVL